MAPLSSPMAFAAPIVEARDGNQTTGLASVVCAFPVSGQYGPGSRILYYVLVATAIFGRGSPWLRSAALAAALLLPMVAALHAVVLAAVHVDAAVDMDVYGAFQLCAIGVLAGPMTVRMSGTYFNAPGRNLIFIWTIIILMGLISLTVEFYRVTPGVFPTAEFVWGFNSTVYGYTCDTTVGPFSPLRMGAQNNIYLIYTPTILTFGAATLLSAACCIPPVLSLVTTWNKILRLNWKKSNRRDDESDIQDQLISGTNSATPRKMINVNERILFYLRMVEIPIYGSAIILIIIFGERNFFDFTVNYMTEPMQSIGQWGPIVGTGLAAAGSLYALLAAGGSEKDVASSDGGEHHCSCHHHDYEPGNDDISTLPPSPGEMEERHGPADLDCYAEGSILSPQGTYQSAHTAMSPVSTRNLRKSRTSTSKGATPTSPEFRRVATAGPAATKEIGSRHKVARIFEKIGDKLGNPAPDAFDDSEFQRGLASDFPEVPAERQRNSNLPKIMKQYNPIRDAEGHATPLRRQRSRTGSFISESSVGHGSETGSPEATSPVAEVPGSSGPSSSMLHQRRATLQVPKPVFLQALKPRRSTISIGSGVGPTPASPTIKVSQHQDEAVEDDLDDEPNTPNSEVAGTSKSHE